MLGGSQLPSEGIVRKARDDNADPWHLGNAALYELCARYPLHTDPREVIAKVWLIGRTYAAAIERRDAGRAGSETLGDDFYIEDVGPRIVESDLDLHIARLEFSSDPEDSLALALEVHAYLISVFRDLTGQDKRSLAAKYLHFHCPRVILIYDDRASRAARKFRPRKDGKTPSLPKGVDKLYAQFTSSALALRKEIHRKYGVSLSPRELDRVLLAVSHGDV